MAVDQELLVPLAGALPCVASADQHAHETLLSRDESPACRSPGARHGPREFVVRAGYAVDAAGVQRSIAVYNRSRPRRRRRACRSPCWRAVGGALGALVGSAASCAASSSGLGGGAARSQIGVPSTSRA